jgi:uncharacterized protein YceK
MRKILLPVLAALIGAGCGGPQKATSVSSGAAAMKANTPMDRSRCDESGKRVVTVDTNRDGKPDVWKMFKGEVMTCKQVDFNHDGKIDYVAHFDPNLVPVMEEFDLDFDGKFDEVVFYERGEVVRKEYDTNHDGVPDIWKYFKDGRLVRLERDTRCAGKVDYWEEYENNKLARIKYTDENVKGGMRVEENPEDADEAEAATPTGPASKPAAESEAAKPAAEPEAAKPAAEAPKAPAKAPAKGTKKKGKGGTK